MVASFPLEVRRYLLRCERAFIGGGEVGSEDRVIRLFWALPGNLDEASVGLKVRVLDREYGTQLWRNSGVEAATEHILRLGHQGLDLNLRKGLPKTLDALASIDGRREFSFATKYAHFSAEKKYPLWDRYADLALKCLDDHFEFYGGRRGFKNPPAANWIQAVTALRKAMGRRVSFRRADHALWVLGYILAQGRRARYYTLITGERPDELY